MNVTVIGEIEIGPLTLTVLTKVRKILMAGKGEEVRVGEVQGGIGTTAGQVGIMINDGEGRDRDQGQGRGLARGREAAIDTIIGDPDPVARIGGTIHTRTGLQGEMEEEGKIVIDTGQGEVPALADQVVPNAVEAEAKVKVVEEVEVRTFVDVVSPCHRNGAPVSGGGSTLRRMNEDPKLLNSI
mmetsp:Transcript_4778/g.7238  ORF Transcript_4778/g.7238 Transcript_4778/m.7238 type:complete len:184 (-) Transcript_4778:28-579(-)